MCANEAASREQYWLCSSCVHFLFLVCAEERQFTDPVRTFAYGTDASFYRLNPKLVVKVHSEDEVRRVLPIAARHSVPVTFRAAGTSLSGQAVTDSVLLKLSHTGKNFRNYTIHVRPPSLPLRPPSLPTLTSSLQLCSISSTEELKLVSCNTSAVQCYCILPILTWLYPLWHAHPSRQDSVVLLDTEEVDGRSGSPALKYWWHCACRVTAARSRWNLG